MDYQELLFAAEVLKLAKALNEKAQAEYLKTIPTEHEGIQNQALNRWDKVHPREEFLLKAMEEIQGAVQVIRSISNSDQAQ